MRYNNQIRTQLNEVFAPLLGKFTQMYYYREYERALSSWIEDVYRLLHSVQPSKILKRLPKESTFWDGLCRDHAECNPYFCNALHYKDVKDLNKFYEKDFHTVKEPDIRCLDFYKDYVVWLGKNLSEKPIVSLEEVSAEIKKLLNRYPLN